MKGYLLTSPIYKNTIQKVWLWNEFPYKDQFGGSDIGIDLVAETPEGKFWAVQCKFYAEDNEIDKAEVDSFISTSAKSFKPFTEPVHFDYRLWISTTNKWSSKAEETIKNQHPAISRIKLLDLENEPIDWERIENDVFGDDARQKPFELKEHQRRALDSASEYFKTNDRGKMIMACGTGKTFTSLRIAEQETGGKGLVLFLVPSIALLGQMLKEWMSQTKVKIYPICVCSDPEVSKKTKQIDEDTFSTVDLALPASTSVPEIVRRLKYARIHNSDGLTVVFSTYQSIDVLSKAQKELLNDEGGLFGKDENKNYGIFDLIICDEAHRTTGVTLKGSDDSNFVKVHYNDFIKAKKRVYMTATPRLYSDEAKSKADKAEAVLCSMDDRNLYGDEFFRIGFGEAVEKGLLSDYKVLILTIKEDNISPTLKRYLTNEAGEINADDAGKIVGCINALSKKMIGDAQEILKSDPEPMHKAVAFCKSIKDSKQITDLLNNCKDEYLADLTVEEREGIVNVNARHIDGTMSAPVRDEKLTWLKSASEADNECRILTNVRCLSEGVDVPSLDAVLFLSPRNSQVDVVQSVGRVMRTSKGKKYGYIIIPVVVPPDMDANEAMDKSDRFKVVWTVLNALRAHDDRFESTVNKIELNKRKPKQVLIGGVSGGYLDGDEWDYAHNNIPQTLNEAAVQLELEFEDLSSTFYAKMVQKVGDKRYWEQWAGDVAKIAEAHIERINKLITQKGKPKKEFEKFLKGLRKNINPSISQNDAVEMLSQHIITKPVFEALFDNYSFVKNNPISKSMQKVIELIEEHTPDEENARLEAFYDSVRRRAKGIDNAEAKQKVIVELYDKFFKTAFPKVVEKLGIVYTPVEVVDYIIKSVLWILKREFNKNISDENINILDPFTGTGTFITRLLQSGVISKEALERKYKNEIFANEIVLLAYYIASINIENVFHDLMGEDKEYSAFDGIVLTDTFQLGEDFWKDNENRDAFDEVFPQNSKRVKDQRNKPITIIIGNPPYSIGQKSANDNAQNQSYPCLERRIEETYVEQSAANLSKSAYDSYVKAFRWASDRIGKQEGIIGFVTNGAWLDANGLDGMRKSLEKEFTSIYVYNLRGNCRTSGELRRKEGGGIFGLGSRTPIAITILVKKPKTEANQKAKIYYHDIGDYLSREDKLKIIKDFGSISDPDMNWQIIEPNEHGDWINQRNNAFNSFIQMEPEKKFNPKSETVFVTNGPAIATGRDSWVYNFSSKKLEKNIERMIESYNEEVKLYKEAIDNNPKIKVEDFIDKDPTQISWTVNLIKYITKFEKFKLTDDIRCSYYRPFCKSNLYYDLNFIERPGISRKLLPSSNFENLIICVSCMGTSKGLSVMLVNSLSDYHCIGDTQQFPLYWYEEKPSTIDLFSLYGDDKEEDKYVRNDGISDWILREFKKRYGNKITKEDIFFYVYGILHSPEYRKEFYADLKKMLPRLPYVNTPEEFFAFSKAGRDLAYLHLNYETIEPYKGCGIEFGANTNKGENMNYRVEKMRFDKLDAKTPDKTRIFYNNDITITNIPLEAYDYIINGKSAIEWIMDRYQVTTDSKSGITNDPNAWCKEHGDEKYIFNLLLRIITVSMETMKIVKSLPKLNLIKILNYNLL